MARMRKDKGIRNKQMSTKRWYLIQSLDSRYRDTWQENERLRRASQGQKLALTRVQRWCFTWLKHRRLLGKTWGQGGGPTCEGHWRVGHWIWERQVTQGWRYGTYPTTMALNSPGNVNRWGIKVNYVSSHCSTQLSGVHLSIFQKLWEIPFPSNHFHPCFASVPQRGRPWTVKFVPEDLPFVLIDCGRYGNLIHVWSISLNTFT